MSSASPSKKPIAASPSSKGKEASSQQITFSLTPEALHALVADKEEGLQECRRLGAQVGLARALRSDTVVGRSDTPEMEAARKATYGINELPPPEEVSFWALLFNALTDKMMLLLMGSAVISLVLGLTTADPVTNRVDYEHGWIEGTAILTSVFLVTFVTSLNDYQKEQKFKELSQSAPPSMINTIRNGAKTDVRDTQLLVGDVVHLEAGQIIPVDGILLKGLSLKVDESAATGENEEVEKSCDGDCMLRSGSNIIEGEALALVTGVGVNSYAGKITMQCREEKQDTPLQEKLEELADSIGKLGMIAAVAMFVALSMKEAYFWYFSQHPLVAKKFLDMLTTSVTIVVVAVPEGLPLSVTIALAYSMKQMMRENNLVRHLAACETMGGATSICTDKTGTLTQNEMTVMRGLLAKRLFEFTGEKARDAEVCRLQILHGHRSTPFIELVAESISLNSTASRKRRTEGSPGPSSPGPLSGRYIGNKTEQAMLIFLERLGIDPMAYRAKHDPQEVHAYPFTSTKKCMTTCVRVPGALRYHVKGASEIVLSECVQYHNGTEVTKLDDAVRSEIYECISLFSRNRLRTLAIAYADVRGKENDPFEEREGPTPPLTFLGLLGIEDPIRPEVEGAVARCKRAGVMVRMVTGDNKATAISIARKAGIYGTVYSGPAKGTGGLAIEGNLFREFAKSEARMNQILPRLQVLARASPLDKQILVAALMKRGEVVAVTGDGTNDAPALKNANVGFAMNSGTEVAKKASDVVILDDNFRSIVTALKWGRNVNDNICKFIQFQTTVNVAAVFIAFVGAIVSGNNESPLKPVQLLWLNLIMDTMAALALATEPPCESVLDRPPRPKNAPLITRRMWLNIMGQASYQILLQLWILNYGHGWFGVEHMGVKHLTIVFNTFVLLQVTNEFNARALNLGVNLLAGLSKARMFVSIIIITLLVQYVGITYAGAFMKTTPLTTDEWHRCIGFALVPLPLGFILRYIPIPEPVLPDETYVPITGEEEEKQEQEVTKKSKPCLRKAAYMVLAELKVCGALAAKASSSNGHA